MSKILTSFILLVLIFVTAALSQIVSAVQYIDVNCSAGPDQLTLARNKIRALQPLNDSVVVRNVAPDSDCYATNSSVPVLELDGKLDSAPSLAVNITYQGPFNIRGGKKVPASAWTKSTKNPNVIMFSLSKTLGITDIGNFAPGSLGQCNFDRLELFVNNAPMTVARTPNADPNSAANGPWMNWYQIDSNVGDTSFTSMPISDSNLVSQLVGKTWNANNSLWVYGYYSFDWADSWISIQSVATGSKPSTFKFGVDPKTPPVYGFKKTARFFVVNDISLLDSPKEYYIDDDLNLHFIPPTTADFNLSTADIWVSENAQPLFSQKENGATLSNVNFDQLYFGYGRAEGMVIHYSNAVTITNSIFNNFGRTGAALSGSNLVFQNNIVSHTGCRSVSMSGGDAKTLTSSNNVFDSNTVNFMGRITRSYNPGLSFSGVGFQVTNNKFSSGPHAAMLGSSNNAVFENNSVVNFVFGSRDAGAFYSGRSWVHRGNVLNKNTFINCYKVEPTFLGSTLVVAMYWDDELSGMKASNNICTNVDGCHLLGGGRDNTITGTSCTTTRGSCIHFDNRGMNWQRAYCTPPNGELVQQLFSVKYTQPPYSTAYPRIVNTLSDRPCVPVGNYIAQISCVDCKQGVIDQSQATISSWNSTYVPSQ